MNEIIRYKKWKEIVPLLHYIKDMKYSYECKTAIRGQHTLNVTNDTKIYVECKCMQTHRTKLLLATWKAIIRKIGYTAEQHYLGTNDAAQKQYFWTRLIFDDYTNSKDLDGWRTNNGELY